MPSNDNPATTTASVSLGDSWRVRKFLVLLLTFSGVAVVATYLSSTTNKETLTGLQEGARRMLRGVTSIGRKLYYYDFADLCVNGCDGGGNSWDNIYGQQNKECFCHQQGSHGACHRCDNKCFWELNPPECPFKRINEDGTKNRRWRRQCADFFADKTNWDVNDGSCGRCLTKISGGCNNNNLCEVKQSGTCARSYEVNYNR